jgi:hypothetical protein
VKKQKFLDVIALAVNVIEILESEETTFFKQHFLDVIALAVHVIIIWILDSEETKVFGCNCTSCKRY